MGPGRAGLDPPLVLSVLLPPRGTSQAFPPAGDTQGQMDRLGWTVSGTGHGAGVALVASGGSWPGRGLLGCRAAGSGGWRRVGGTGMERGFAGSCSPRMRDQNPAGSPTALPPPPTASQRAQGGSGWGQSGGFPPPCTPSASLSLPRVHGLRPPCGDRDPLLLRQWPGGPHGAGVPLGVVISLLEVSRASGGFAQGDQAGQGGLGGAQPWGHPL